MESDTDFLRFRTLNQTKAPYSGRITESQWNIYKADITIMHAAGRTRPRILDMLRTEGFVASPKQLRTKMSKWGLHLNSYSSTSISGVRESHGRIASVATKLDESKSEIDINDSGFSPKSIDLQSTSDENTFTEGPGVFGWPSYAAHSIPNRDQPARSASVDDAQSDDESVISRQTFATHPSDSSSIRCCRREYRRFHEIHKLDSQDRPRVYKSIIIRSRKYECHICNKVGMMSKNRDQRCKRCYHKRCVACLEWPRSPQPLRENENENDALRISPCYPIIMEEDPENDVEVLFGVNLAS